MSKKSQLHLMNNTTVLYVGVNWNHTEMGKKIPTTKALHNNGHFLLEENHHYFQAVSRDDCPQLSISALVEWGSGWGGVSERMKAEQEKSINLTLWVDCYMYLLYHKLTSISLPSTFTLHFIPSNVPVFALLPAFSTICFAAHHIFLLFSPLPPNLISFFLFPPITVHTYFLSKNSNSCLFPPKLHFHLYFTARQSRDLDWPVPQKMCLLTKLYRRSMTAGEKLNLWSSEKGR